MYITDEKKPKKNNSDVNKIKHTGNSGKVNFTVIHCICQ